MSSGNACKCKGSRKEKMKNWRVLQRHCNHSAFNGYHYTPSDYSSIHCIGKGCPGSWRTKADYVYDLPDYVAGEQPDER